MFSEKATNINITVVENSLTDLSLKKLFYFDETEELMASLNETKWIAVVQKQPAKRTCNHLFVNFVIAFTSTRLLLF